MPIKWDACDGRAFPIFFFVFGNSMTHLSQLNCLTKLVKSKIERNIAD